MSPQLAESANHLKHFVTDEDGTTAVLATLLDPEFNHPLQPEIHRRFARLLRNGGIDVAEDSAPSSVRPQYLAIDLVMTWGNWILLIENKVLSASVTPNQLSRYYRVSLQELVADRFLGDKSLRDHRIGVVYLTPTANVGGAEFESLLLAVDRADRKLHLAWPQLVADWNDVLANENEPSAFALLARDAVRRATDILAKDRTKKTVETPHRIAAKKFLDELQTRVLEVMRPMGAVKLSRWKDPRVDQLYGWLGGEWGNVYLDVVEDGSDLSAHSSVARVRLSFWVAAKAAQPRKKEFATVPVEHWARLIGLPFGQLEGPEDPRHYGVQWDNAWSGSIETMLEQLTMLFCRFLITFRPFMEVDGASSHDQPRTN
jgi:hypothetical protein